MSKPFYVAVFCEEAFADGYAHASLAEADAFASGVAIGAEYYGAGYCCAYVLPREQTELLKEEDTVQSELAMQAYAAEMERQRVAEKLDGDE